MSSGSLAFMRHLNFPGELLVSETATDDLAHCKYEAVDVGHVASGHLTKLVEGNLIKVERQGRHRYYCLVSTEVAEAVEPLLTLTAGTDHLAARETTTPIAGTLKYARTCYAHLAGWLGVQITDALQSKGLLLPAGRKAFAVIESGRSWFQALGIPVPEFNKESSTRIAKQCIDWTERRPHLAGGLGVAMYKRFIAFK